MVFPMATTTRFAVVLALLNAIAAQTVAPAYNDERHGFGSVTNVPTGFQQDTMNANGQGAVSDEVPRQNLQPVQNQPPPSQFPPQQQPQQQNWQQTNCDFRNCVPQAQQPVPPAADQRQYDANAQTYSYSNVYFNNQNQPGANGNQAFRDPANNQNGDPNGTVSTSFQGMNGPNGSATVFQVVNVVPNQNDSAGLATGNPNVGGVFIPPMQDQRLPQGQQPVVTNTKFTTVFGEKSNVTTIEITSYLANDSNAAAADAVGGANFLPLFVPLAEGDSTRMMEGQNQNQPTSTFSTSSSPAPTTTPVWTTIGSSSIAPDANQPMRDQPPPAIVVNQPPTFVNNPDVSPHDIVSQIIITKLQNGTTNINIQQGLPQQQNVQNFPNFIIGFAPTGVAAETDEVQGVSAISTGAIVMAADGEGVPLLVNADYLRNNLRTGQMKVLDATRDLNANFYTWQGFRRNAMYGQFEALSDIFPNTEFQSSHIPSAVHFDLNVATYPTQFQRFTLYPPEVFEAYVRSLGINNDDYIIVYSRDSVGGMRDAAAVWELFRIYNHTRISVLNGGLNAWIASGYDAMPDNRTVPTGNWSAGFVDPMLVTFEELSALQPDGRFYLQQPEMFNFIDTRSRAEFSTDRLGGAKSLPVEELVDANGFLQSRSAIENALNSVGYDPAVPSFVMGNDGIDAALAVLAMTVTGAPEVRLFNGGYDELRDRTPGLLLTP